MTAVIVAGVALFAMLVFTSYKLLTAARSSMPLGAAQVTLLTNSGDIVTAAIAPNGKYLVYARKDQYERCSLWIRQIGTGGDRLIGLEEIYEYQQLIFSPDGSYLYFIATDRDSAGSRAIYQRPTLGGVVKKVVEDVSHDLALSRDGKRLAFFRDDIQRGEHLLIVANYDGTEERILNRRQSPDVFVDGVLDWSPDGKALVCRVITASGKGPTQGILMSVRLSDGWESPIRIPRFRGINDAKWLPDGTGLILVASELRSPGAQIWHLIFPNGEAHQLTNNNTSIYGLSLDAAARVIASIQQTENSSVWVGKDVKARRVISGIGSNVQMAWAPDGTLVYAARIDGRIHLWRTGIGDQIPTRLTFGDGSNNSLPVASPDGEQIVFVSTRSKKVNIWRMKSDGSDMTQLTSGQVDQTPSISPDGQWVVYTSLIKEGGGVFRVRIDGGPPEQLATAGFVASPVVSPDGELLAYIQATKSLNQLQVVVAPFNGGAPVKIFDWPSTRHKLLRWGPDGKGLTYIDTQSGNSEIWYQSLTGEPAKKLTDLGLGRISYFAWSWDGRQLAVSRNESTSDVLMVQVLK